MDWLQALILGIIQGLAEYLPISSSGHLEIFRQILGIDLGGKESLAFDVTLHVATVLSTIFILWKEFLPLCTSFFTFKRDENFTYVLKILVSCIPVAIVGLAFKPIVEQFFEGNLVIVGTCLMVTALLLAFSYFFRTSPVAALKKGNEGRDITWVDAIIIGIARTNIPGVNRSSFTRTLERMRMRLEIPPFSRIKRRTRSSRPSPCSFVTLSTPCTCTPARTAKDGSALHSVSKKRSRKCISPLT